MNKLTNDKRQAVVAALVEGNSIRATVRMTGVAKNTIIKLLVELGEACAAYQDNVFHDLKCKRIQCDEIWSFVGCKEKAKASGCKGDGDVWVWTAIDADTKLMPSFLVGLRDAGHAYEFMQDVARRMASRVQLTTDGLHVYMEAVEGAFGSDIDYARLVKVYGSDPNAKRPEPAKCLGVTTHTVTGNPDPMHISTSYVERANLTMRMGMRRFTRLTNAFSKKVENHAAAVALHFAHYNFCRIHQTLRITPAMAAGLADHVWGISELIDLLDGVESN